MNTATLSHPVTLRNILQAMRNAQKWGIDHVRNQRGNAWLAVRYNGGKWSVTDKRGASVALPLRLAATQYSAFYNLLSDNLELRGHTNALYTNNGKLIKIN